jgi:CTP synthase (UTP-ammonia lyase)
MPPGSPVHLRVVGDRNPTYLSHRELDAALALLPAGVAGAWHGTDDPAVRDLSGVDGVWVAPGSPYRDDEAVLAVIGAARTGGLPLLATCGGFQYAALEYARNVAGLTTAAHAEVDPGAADPVIAPLACSLFGLTRQVQAVPGTRLAAIVGTAPFQGTHFCSFGLAPAFVTRLDAAGLVMDAHAPDAGVEGFELPGHPFFLATLFQPQVGASRGGPLHPLVLAFVEAARTARAGLGRGASER